MKFLGRKLGLEGGKIPHYTRLVQHLSINHRRWSVEWWEDHPSENAVVIVVCLSGVTIKLVKGCWVCFQPSHFLFLRVSVIWGLVALLGIFFSVWMLKLKAWLSFEQRTKLSCNKKKLKVKSGVKSCQHVTSQKVDPCIESLWWRHCFIFYFLHRS